MTIPAALVALGLAASSTAHAEEPPVARPTAHVYMAQLDVIRLNPLGLESQNRLMYEKRLMDSESVLFSNTFFGAGLGLKLNPAFVKVGPLVELQPIALLHIRAGYEFMQFFGTFDYLQSYPEPTDPAAYSDDNRELNADAAYITNGHHIFVEPTFQIKGGPVAIRSKTGIEYWIMGLEGTDTVWYDATLDTYVPGTGMVITNDSDVLYLAGKLTAGARFSMVSPKYNDSHFVNGTVPSDFTGMNHMRVGPLVAYTVKETKGEAGGAKAGKGSVLVNVSWYLNHPNREGAMPYILLGYAWNKDLMAKF